MLGHGRPIQLGGRTFHLLPTAAHRLLRFVCAIAWIAFPLAVRAEEVELRLRLFWGGGEPRPWVGKIGVTGGAFSDLAPLGTEPDEHASVWLATGEVNVVQRRPRAQSGVDVTVRAPREAQLLVLLGRGDAPPRDEPVAIPISSLLAEPANKPLDDKENRLQVQRSPDDRLRVRAARNHWILAPGEALRMTIEPHLAEVPAETRARLQVTLREARGGRIWNQWDFDRVADAQGNLATVDFDSPAPGVEGAYELTLNLSGKRRARKATFAERAVQFVVVASRRPSSDAPPAATTFDKLVEEIDPSSPAKTKRLPVLQARRKLPVGLGEARPSPHPLGTLMELAPEGREPRIAWEAYTLSVQETGVPHMLEVEYPTDVTQTLGISVLEPNAAGMLGSVGVDSGVYVGEEQTTAEPALAKHRMVFWPKSTAPLVLLTNRRDGARAVFGKLRVWRGPTELPPADFSSSGEGRTLAAYFERPLLVENFSATDALDASTGRPLNDWQTHLEAATRLADYLKYAGYSGVVLSAALEGSALYPSTVAEPTPRWENGALFSTGQDPAPKDVLELICRVFDREGLELTPAIDLAAPLPALETLRRGGSEPGIEWIGPDGAPLSVHEAGPRYNLLHPRVQEAAFAAVHEIIARYGRHPCFGGIALQLTGGSFAVLPGLEYGVDDATVECFQRDTGIRLNVAGGSQRFSQRARQLTAQHRKDWEAWRTGQVTRWQQELQEELSRTKPTARLLLTGTGLFDRRDVQRDLLPALPRKISVEGALYKAGLDVDRLSQQSGAVLLRPTRLGAPGPLEGQALDLALAQATGLDRAIGASPRPAALLFQPPLVAQAPGFDARSPARGSHVRLITQASGAGARPLVHSLATLDAHVIVDGGAMLTLGKEESQRDLVRLFRSLPSVTFDTLTPEPQPAIVRTFADDRQTWMYAANDSPWPTTVSLEVIAPTGCVAESLDGRRPPPPLPAGGPSVWELKLEPYDAWGARFNMAGVRLGSPRATLPEATAAALRARINDLRDRVGLLHQAPRLEALANPGFEAVGSGELPAPHWQLSPTGEGQLRLDGSEKHGGEMALVVASDGPPVSLLSDPFPAPTTGRISVWAWMRIGDPDNPPTLRLALQGELRGQDYYRYAALGSGQEHALRGGWSLYKFRVDDLPLEGLTKLRARFDLMGAGEVWIDDVELSDLNFTEKEQRELQLLVFSAYEKLEQGQYRECQQILEGYWPRFLVQHIPLSQPRMARQPEPAAAVRPTPPPDAAKKPASPGILESMRTRLNPFKWR